MSFFGFGKSDRPTELEILSRRFSNILALLKDAVIVYDKNFKILLFNSAAAKIYNLSREDVVGKTFTPNKAMEEKYTILVQTLFPSLAPAVTNESDPGVFPQISEIKFPEPLLVLKVATAPIEAQDGNSLFAKIITNITKEIHLQQAKAEFIHSASHQLRTPLTSISWTFEILKADQTIVGESREALEQGIGAVKKFGKILNDLLDVSKIEEGQLGYVMQKRDLISFIDEAVVNAKDYISAAKLKLRVNFKTDLDKLLISFDPNRLGAALSNILDNAIKYNVENGEITITAEALKEKPYVQVSVTDTGIGIPEDKMSAVFTKFFRAENAKKAVTEGLGLGLFIARSIVKRHGGSMWVESVLGRGTTVRFTLPTDPKLIPTQEIVYE